MRVSAGDSSTLAAWPSTVPVNIAVTFAAKPLWVVRSSPLLPLGASQPAIAVRALIWSTGGAGPGEKGCHAGSTEERRSGRVQNLFVPIAYRTSRVPSSADGLKRLFLI